LAVSDDTDLCDLTYTCKKMWNDHHPHNQNREVTTIPPPAPAPP
jgi:hypothetical protein